MIKCCCCYPLMKEKTRLKRSMFGLIQGERPSVTASCSHLYLSDEVQLWIQPARPQVVAKHRNLWTADGKGFRGPR